MSPNNKRAVSVEAFALESVTSSSSYQENCEDGLGGPDHSQPSTLLGRVLLSLGLGDRRRKGGHEYEAAPSDENPAILKRHPRHPPRELRRCGRSHVAGFLKRALFALPFLVLMLFGALHILQVMFGRGRLLWDGDTYDDFLPDWNKPGYVGEYLADYPTDITRDILPVACHSHNDYWRRVPLFEALHYGCTGVEADVWMYDEELYVGHNLASLTRNRTLKSLYVNPLIDLLDKMNPTTEFTNASGHGVFDVDHKQPLILLIDFKTNGHDTWPVVSKQLEPLREKGYLTHWDGDKVHTRAVTVVGTGNTPFDMVVQNTQYRDIFFDAPLTELWEQPRKPIDLPDPAHANDARMSYPEAMSLPSSREEASGQGNVGIDLALSADAFNTSTSYYASVSFRAAVGFVWRGHLSPRQMDIIRGQIRGAQRRGLKVRYWDTPSWPISLRNHVWHVLMKEGADMLNADDLRAAATADWKFRGRHRIWT